MKMRIAVVVPNWNGEEHILDCLLSLGKQIPARIIVVDNGSIDKSVKIITEKFPDTKIIRLDKNHGFAGGVNTGINWAINHNFEYIALFNNDAVAHKNWLNSLVGIIEKQTSVGIVTGKFLRMDKQHIDSTGECFSTYGMPFPRGRNQIDSGQYDTAEAVFGASGGASLYRASMLKKIGLFDEAFFAYFEDVDISFRAQLAGWKVWYEPKAIAYHHVGGTSGKLGSFSRYHAIKNFMLLYTKNMPGWLYWKYLPNFIYQLSRMKLGAIRDGLFWVFIKAWLKTILLLPGTLLKRREVQRQRSVSTKDINAILHHGKPPKIPTIGENK